MEELTAWLKLARVPGLHGSELSPLLDHFAEVSALITASPAALREAGANDKFVRAIQRASKEAIDADLRWLDHENHHWVCWGSPDYPALLSEVPDAPIGVFIRGNRSL